MVKGISRQVIVLHGPDTEMFEQAIFIIKDGAQAVTEETLMKEAKKLLHSGKSTRRLRGYGPVWACGGAVLTALVWLVTSML